MKLCWLREAFSVCKWNTDIKELPEPEGVYFLSKTPEELSLVCETAHVPGSPEQREDGWSCFRVVGTLEFSLIGILAGLTGALAAQDVGVFVVSTFDTDYILVRTGQRRKAEAVLKSAGYQFEGGTS